jgi:hypothetical protein
MREDDEKKFLVHVIKDLLGLVEIVHMCVCVCVCV